MQGGQWVAFDANTDIPHKHNKRSRAQKSPNYKYDNTLNSERKNDINPENESYHHINKPEQKNFWPYIIIGILILIFIYN